VYDGKPPLKSIALSAYPQADDLQVDTVAETEMAILQDLIVAVRNIRAEMKIEPKQKLEIEIHADPEIRSLVERNRSSLDRMANVESVAFVDASLANAAGARSTARFDVQVIYERKIDVAAERDRLNKELLKMTGEIGRAAAQLGNDAFLAKAPAKVIEGIKTRRAELERSWIGQAAESPQFWRARCMKIALPATPRPTPALTRTSGLRRPSSPSRIAFSRD
jgi:valyl-tRNA synthetase